ncbi:MAG: MarR family transcriptional regulator [Propionibacteriales bacterium]|nr:MarR family transcriptional regulator [Propionibacteriales bacterium]
MSTAEASTTGGAIAADDRVQARWLTAEQQTAWRNYLLGAARLSERLDADLRKFGIDLGEYEILVTLEESPGRRVRMSELADRVHQSRSRLTHTIARMEKSNLVVRTMCPSDRRGVWAQLTPTGFDLLKSAAPSHVACVRRNFVEAVGEQDFAVLGRAFAAVLAVENDD